MLDLEVEMVLMLGIVKMVMKMLPHTKEDSVAKMAVISHWRLQQDARISPLRRWKTGSIFVAASENSRKNMV
jgi:hypothetical protein